MGGELLSIKEPPKNTDPTTPVEPRSPRRKKPDLLAGADGAGISASSSHSASTFGMDVA